MAEKENVWVIAMENDVHFLREVGVRIREIRKERGLTQSELAKRLGVTQALIASYELARRSIPLRKLVALADALGISVEEVVGQPVPQRRNGKRGPASKMERRLFEIEKLPPSERLFVTRMLDNALAR